MDLGHWQDFSFHEEAIGFVYEISKKEPIEGEPYRYIGQKLMRRKKKYPPLKSSGSTRNRWIMKDTDWKKYESSSKDLQAQIAEYGKDAFNFVILKQCFSKSEMNYFETKLQFELGVLFDPSYYNGILNCRIGKFKIHPDQTL